MAYRKKNGTKRLKIVDPDAPPAPPDTSEQATASATQPAEAAAPAPKVPRKVRGGTFWDHLNAIKPEEWDAHRYYLYVYLEEPFCNIKIEGEPGYLGKFYEAIEPDTVMHRWGSGKYFLRLKTREAGEKGDRDVDTLHLQILNSAFPPRLPRKLWENDPRNEKWLAMLPKDPVPESGDAATKMFDTFLNIQGRIKDEMQQPETQDPTSQLASTVEIAKNLMEMARPKEDGKPVMDPWDAAEKVLNMRSQNPMVEALRDDMKAMREELKEERAESRRLQEKLFEKQNPTTPATAPKTLLDQIKEAKEVLTSLGVPLGGENGGPVRRGSAGPLEYVQALAPLLAPVTDALGGWIKMQQVRAMQQANGMQPPAMQSGPPMQPNGSQPQQTNGQPRPQNTQADFLKWVNDIVTPAMLRFLEAEQSGEDLADWLYEGYGAEPVAMLQTITHPMLPGKTGAEVITHLYQQSPLWARIQLHEARFTEFVKDFCAWRPEAKDAGDNEPDAEDEREEAIDV